MKKVDKFIIFLLVVLTTLIGCSKPEGMNIKVCNSSVTVSNNGKLVSSKRSMDIQNILVELTDSQKDVLNVKETSTIYTNVLNVEELTKLEEISSIYDSKNVNTELAQYINDKILSSEFMDAILAIKQQIPNIDPIKPIFVIDNPILDNKIVKKPPTIVECFYRDGKLYIGLDSDGDGKADYWLIIIYDSCLGKHVVRQWYGDWPF